MKPLSEDGLQQYSVSFEHDGLLRKCHGNIYSDSASVNAMVIDERYSTVPST